MKDVLENNSLCTGCTACMVSCPVQAIHMEENEEGFLYPKIDMDKCIKCGLCQRRCPALNKLKKEEYVSSYFAFCTNDNKTWLQSSSGGAFSEICACWCSIYGDDCLIYGATMDEDNVVKHIEVKLDEIKKLRKSKYVQSNLSDIFLNVKNSLENDRSVIFSGTPCQINGLKKFLNKDYDKLLCIDLICHGVGSPAVFKKNINLIEETENKKLKKYQFRYKRKPFEAKDRHLILYKFKDNKKIVTQTDTYIDLFLKELVLRKCCGANCNFKAIENPSDITLADFNNKSLVFPKLYDYRNYSTIVIKSKKAEQLISSLEKRGKLIPTTEEVIVKNNPMFSENSKTPIENRDDFFKEWKKDPEKTLKKYEVKEKNNKEYTKYIPYFIKYCVNNILSWRRK